MSKLYKDIVENVDAIVNVSEVEYRIVGNSVYAFVKAPCGFVVNGHYQHPSHEDDEGLEDSKEIALRNAKETLYNHELYHAKRVIEENGYDYYDEDGNERVPCCEECGEPLEEHDYYQDDEDEDNEVGGMSLHEVIMALAKNANRDDDGDDDDSEQGYDIEKLIEWVNTMKINRGKDFIAFLDLQKALNDRLTNINPSDFPDEDKQDIVMNLFKRIHEIHEIDSKQ